MEFSLPKIGLAAALLLAPAAGALDLSDDPAEKGQQISQAAKDNDAGFGDSEAIMQMVLTNAHGDTSTRELRMRTLENPAPDDGDKSMIIFDRPRDVEGTALLTHAHILNPDDQWLFLPSLGRVKRISSANKSGPFMGSEFAYEDFSSQEPAKFANTWLREEACPIPAQKTIPSPTKEPISSATGELTESPTPGNEPPVPYSNAGGKLKAPVTALSCHVIERRPLYEKSGYTRQMTWVDTQDLQVRKVDYYDRKNALLKILIMSDYRLYEDKHWRAHDLYMVNQNNQKTTRLTWTDFKFKSGFDASDFDKNSLKRAR